MATTITSNGIRRRQRTAWSLPGPGALALAMLLGLGSNGCAHIPADVQAEFRATADPIDNNFVPRPAVAEAEAHMRE